MPIYIEITCPIIDQMDRVIDVSLEALMVLVAEQSLSITWLDIFREHHHLVRF